MRHDFLGDVGHELRLSWSQVWIGRPDEVCVAEDLGSIPKEELKVSLLVILEDGRLVFFEEGFRIGRKYKFL